VPAEVAFATKPKLGLRMLERALDAGVPCAWVTGDSVYGADRTLRRRIEARGGLGYVLAVTSGQRLGGRRVDDWAAKVPPEGWHRLSAGEGAKGPRLYDWAFLPYRGGAPPGYRGGAPPGYRGGAPPGYRGGAPPGRATGLLVRRKLDEPDELAFYLTLAPPDTDLATLVRVAGTRWTIESCFEAAKGEVGLDQYEVRSWTGWHRHVTLAMLAHAYLAAVREAAVGGRGAARLGRGPAAADRAGGAAPALALGVGTSTRPGRRPGLVPLAPAPPAARPPLPRATTDRLA
jgi:SRSO17 transposase